MLLLKELNKLYAWIVSPLHTDVDFSELKDELIARYTELPETINSIEQKSSDYTVDYLLRELFERIEYSNPLSFLILNKGRKYLERVWLLLTLFMFGVIYLSGILSSFININQEMIGPLVFFLMIVCILLNKLNKILFDKILIQMKPGDLLKIFLAKDEVIVQEKEIMALHKTSLLPNPTAQMAESKKKLICENYREQIRNRRNSIHYRGIYNLLTYFIATDFLLCIEENKDEANEETIEYFLEDCIETLNYIQAFKPDSLFILYSLGFYELRLEHFENSRKYFEKYYEMKDDDLDVNTWLIVLKFLDNH